MKRERPPMPPLAVRVKVAERQFRADLNFPMWVRMDYAELVGRGDSLARRLKYLLTCLFNGRPVALDHDSALILRKYNPRVKNVAARYEPHAHSIDHLVYREKADHQQKTTGRKPGAERTVTTKGSDVHLKTKFNRLEGRTKKRRKAKIHQRKTPWPKRKMR